MRCRRRSCDRRSRAEETFDLKLRILPLTSLLHSNKPSFALLSAAAYFVVDIGEKARRRS